jgi:toxin FitB
VALLIDTNIISEIQKGWNGNVEVQRWYEGVDRHDIFVSVLVVGELKIGIERLRRRNAEQAQVLEQRMKRLEILMGERILPVTQAIVERWAQYNVPDPIPVIDGLIAATAAEHDLILVTRNVKDIERTGVRYLNSFVASP